MHIHPVFQWTHTLTYLVAVEANGSEMHYPQFNMSDPLGSVLASFCAKEGYGLMSPAGVNPFSTVPTFRRLWPGERCEQT